MIQDQPEDQPDEKPKKFRPTGPYKFKEPQRLGLLCEAEIISLAKKHAQRCDISVGRMMEPMVIREVTLHESGTLEKARLIGERRDLTVDQVLVASVSAVYSKQVADEAASQEG